MSRVNQFIKGIKVVDLSRHLPGPLASMLLADLGAEVLKVEPPQGDEMRFIGPQAATGNSAYFDAVNGNKSGIRLNLKEDTDKQELLKLLEDADIFIESFRPGVLEKLGIGIQQLRENFPRLIICSLNGYGSNGPMTKDAGHDLNYLALNGLLEGTGSEEQPIAPYPPVADCTASLFGVTTVLAALFERERSGQGCHVEVALTDSVMPLMSFSLADLTLTGKGTARAQDLLNGGAARYRTYSTKDNKSIALGAVEPKFWQAFCAAAEKPEWLDRINDPLPQRDLQAELTDYFKSLTLSECNDKFVPADCCYNEVLELADAVETPHIKARKLVVQSSTGEYQALYPAYVDGEPSQARSAFQEK